MARVLVIGSGGREHALCDKFASSSHVDQVYAAPGNPGMKDCATIVDIAANQFAQLAQFAQEQEIDLTFVGPEIPLADGIVDYFQARNLTIFGPNKQAAQLESSKAFAKEFMKRHEIPTAAYQTFQNYEQAQAYLQEQANYPIVLKADGLAAGKGVVIAGSAEEACQELDAMMNQHKFASAGHSVVIEEFLMGEEFSLLAFVHEDQVYPMQIAQDHKRAFDQDTGPNTGGMGAYTPVSHLPHSVMQEALQQVMIPAAKGMVADGCPFTGVLYGGFMATAQGVKTIEFNVRFGDPETEVLLPAMKSDLYEVIQKVLAKQQMEVVFHDTKALGVVIASKGYPEHYVKGQQIKGLTDIDAKKVRVYHMGTYEDQGEIKNNGGRVLFVMASANTMEEARKVVYDEVRKIDGEALFYRSDIGYRNLQ